MPWLALPFRDPRCERLMHCLGHPHDWNYLKPRPSLVIIGPHGEFIEPNGADIIGRFKLPAYPITCERVAKLDTEKVRELTLDMLWDRNTFFRGKDGSKVRFSQLVGKRIILFFEGNDWRQGDVRSFFNELKERYLEMKGTSNEFEVIYITNGTKQSPVDEHVKDVPSWFVPSWFVSLASELLPIDLSVYCCYCHLLSVPVVFACWCGLGEWRRRSSMLAFDQDGRVVIKSLLPCISNTHFPFYFSSMEEEAFYELSYLYNWGKSW